MATSCAAVGEAASAAAAPQDVTLAAGDQPSFPEKEFDFVERPSQDFFCPVSFELLLEPQQTSCCGNHFSLEVANRLRREGKACPVCNGEQWSAMLDKYHRRKVHEVRVRCWNKDRGCGWVGEVNDLKRHDGSCDKRPWECEYCGLKCTYREGEGKHWPECDKFPEPCPNGCEVGSVERCGMEHHRSVCPLEPVACEMKEFGCSVVLPRKELVRHMKESELQHLTAMTALNLRLTRQLQQESAERDKRIQQLLQDSAEKDRKMENLQHQVAKLNKSVEEMKTRELTQVQEMKDSLCHVEQHTCSGGIVFEVNNYKKCKDDSKDSHSRAECLSDVFYSHQNGYAFKLVVKFYEPLYNDIGVLLRFVPELSDKELQLVVPVSATLELLNQVGNHHHEVRKNEFKVVANEMSILDDELSYPDLEEQNDDVQYMMNDCLKFRIHVTVVSRCF